jgi:putative colanic acid biosynthesis glycosyltransferase WcaI
MRILLLNLYFPPDTSATAKVAASMVQAFAATHDVTVLCGRPSYDPTERRPWKLWQTERLKSSDTKNITIIRVGSTDYSRLQMNRRLLNYLTYVKLAFLRALFIPCDAIFSMTDPPFQGIVAAMLAVLKRKPLIYNIQDLYPDMAIAGSIVKPGPLSRIWERLHRWTLRRATRVIVLGEDMRARIISKGISPEKISVVRNVLDVSVPESDTPSDKSAAPPLNPAVIKAIRGNFRFVLLHAGNLGFYGAWDTIISAARLLETENIGFVFVGDGAERARLQSLASHSASADITGAQVPRSSSNIRFLPFFHSQDIPSVLAAPDAHLVTIKKGLEGVVVPSKMFGILAAGKPIVAVASPETEVSTLGINEGLAVCANPTDPKELASIIRLLAADPSRLNAMSQAASAASRRYSRASELNTLLRIVAQLETTPQ